jgi:hypothetical protein
VVNSIDINARTIDEAKANEIVNLAKLGGISIPRLVNQATMQTLEGASL